LEKLEFEEFLSKLGIFLARQELTAVYNAFDVNQDGKIQYDEFINVLRVITLAVFNPS
jgi:Ca2+-binding EF-hand superfamily protein